MKQLMICYFTILCLVAIVGCVRATIQYRKTYNVEKLGRLNLIGALINFGVALIAFVIILLNI